MAPILLQANNQRSVENKMKRKGPINRNQRTKLQWVNCTKLSQPAHYFVSQIQKKRVILVLDIRKEANFSLRYEAPVLMELKSEENQYHPFDEIEVSSYLVAKNQNGLQPIQYYDNTQIRQCLARGQLMSTTSAQNYRVLLRTPETTFPAFVQYAIKPSVERSVVDIVAKELKGQERILDERVVGFRELPETGSPVEVLASPLPENALEFESSFQGHTSRYYLTNEFQREGGIAIADSRYYPLRVSPNKTSISANPFEDLQLLEPEEIEAVVSNYEKFLQNSALFAHERIKAAFWKTRAEPENVKFTLQTGEKFHNAKLSFIIPYDSSKPQAEKIFASRTKLWNEETVLNIERAGVNPWISQSGIKTTITSVEILEDKSMLVESFMENDELKLALKKMPEALLKQVVTGLIFYPATANTGYERLMKQLENHCLTQAVKDETNISRREIILQLMGLKLVAEKERIEASPRQEIFENVTLNLNKEQSELISMLENPKNTVVPAQAAGGTGKTEVAALYMSILCLKGNVPKIIVTAPTNLAVQNLAKKFLKLLPNTQIGDLLFLQSVASEINQDYDEDDQVWQRYRVPETLSYLYQQGNNKVRESTFISDYCQDRLGHDGTTKGEGKAIMFATQICQPKLIFGTVTMIQKFLELVQKEETEYQPNYLIADEGGLIPEITMHCLIAKLPRIEQVLILGDRYQLPAYTENLPECSVIYGHEGVLQAVTKRKAIKTVELIKSYRSHPLIVQALSQAAYENKLEPMLGADQRIMWKQLCFPPPNDQQPILLIDVKGIQERTESLSYNNNDQNRVALMIWNYVRRMLPHATVEVLCYYGATVGELKKLEPGIRASTVTKFQGSEADIGCLRILTSLAL